jgi:hypothetical protein
VESDTSPHTNRVRGEMSKLFWARDVVHHGRCIPEGSVNMHRTDEFDGTILEFQRSKDRKRVKSVKVQNRPAMNNTEPGRDTA